VQDNYLERYARVFRPTEIKMMLAAFANMETVHIVAYALLLETLGMPDSEFAAFLDYDAMRDAFLRHYADCLTEHTALFPGIAQLLEDLAARDIAWGIVTNKATRFTDRIVETLGLAPACVVCGDTTQHLKPHPAPMLHAAEELKLPANACMYLGDDLRDIQAALAAEMRAIAVGWGYHHPEGGGPRSWKAEAVIGQPADLIALL